MFIAFFRQYDIRINRLAHTLMPVVCLAISYAYSMFDPAGKRMFGPSLMRVYMLE